MQAILGFGTTRARHVEAATSFTSMRRFLLCASSSPTPSKAPRQDLQTKRSIYDPAGQYSNRESSKLKCDVTHVVTTLRIGRSSHGFDPRERLQAVWSRSRSMNLSNQDLTWR